MNAAAIKAFGEKSALTGEGLWSAMVRINGGDSLAAAVTDPRGVPSLVPGGELEQGELVVRIRKSILPERPALHLKLEWKRPTEAEWRAKKWQIEEVTGNDCDAVWLIKCIPWN